MFGRIRSVKALQLLATFESTATAITFYSFLLSCSVLFGYPILLSIQPAISGIFTMLKARGLPSQGILTQCRTQQGYDTNSCVGDFKISNRKFNFCPARDEFDPDENIVVCSCCGDFSIYCCAHGRDLEMEVLACHHYRLIMVDGGCPGNGRPDARAGLGIA